MLVHKYTNSLHPQIYVTYLIAVIIAFMHVNVVGKEHRVQKVSFNKLCEDLISKITREQEKKTAISCFGPHRGMIVPEG